MNKPRFRLRWLAAILSIGPWPCAQPVSATDPIHLGRTPPRLSYVHGEVSFHRPAWGDWTAARINTPLAPGDQLRAAAGSVFEIQIGGRDYLRADEHTQIAIEAQDRTFLQVSLVAGRLSLDLRSPGSAQSIGVDTPNATVVIEGAGYYRAEVSEEETRLLVRRGGRGTVTPLGGTPVTVASGTAVSVRGIHAPSLASYPAPDTDAWDGWNQGRSDQLTRTSSSQYLPDNTYGAEELDRHGSWRQVPPYGPVWVPHVVAAGWVPYSRGSWIWDGDYGWTWLSYDPWGWAPFHYGRWVYLDGYWAWAPGPRVAVAIYYPALVAFFGGPVSAGVALGAVGWVALGWGEPVYPWWGPPGFIGRPCWYGWGGPRVVHKTKIVNKTKIIKLDDYSNARNRRGIVIVPRHRFGHDHIEIEKVRLDDFDPGRLLPIQGRLPVRPAALTRLTANRPPNRLSGRRVVGPSSASERPRERALQPKVVRLPGMEVDRERGEEGVSPAVGERRGERHAAPPPARARWRRSGFDQPLSRPPRIEGSAAERHQSPPRLRSRPPSSEKVRSDRGPLRGRGPLGAPVHRSRPAEVGQHRPRRPTKESRIDTFVPEGRGKDRRSLRSDRRAGDLGMMESDRRERRGKRAAAQSQ